MFQSVRSLRWLVLALLPVMGCALFEDVEVSPATEADCAELGAVGNGLDDDNDGVADEGCRCDYAETPVGVCEGGLISDTLGEDGEAVCLRPKHHSGDEIYQCDGRDNDCDGTVDEGCLCDFQGIGVGVCALGRVGEEGLCGVPAEYQGEETICDGYDNDCDSQVDEGCGVCTFQGITLGVCRAGVDEDGECGAPKNYRLDERDCEDDPLGGDGVDNDCDGLVDEGCACDFGGEDAGVCSLGRKVEGGEDVEGEGCDAPLDYQPDEDRCDGLDNDCDGDTDEGCDPGAPVTPPDRCWLDEAGCPGPLEPF